MISGVKQFADYVRLFYQYAGWRLPTLLVLIAGGGVLEALGIVALLPLLNIAVSESAGGELSRAVLATLEWAGVAPTLPNLLLLMVVIFALRGVLVFLYTYFTAYITVSVRRKVQTDLTEKFCKMSFPYYVQRSVGWFNNMIVAEVARFISSMRTFSRLMVNVINTLIFLPLALSLKFELTLAAFLIGGFILWSLRGLIQQTASLSRKQTLNNAALNAEFIQLIQGFIYLKSTGLMEAVNRHVIRTIGELARIEMTIKRVTSFLESIREPIAVTALAALVFYEVSVRGGSLAEIVVVALLLYRMLIKLVSLAPLLQTFNQTIGGLFAVRDTARELAHQAERGGDVPVGARAVPITFHQVSFRHNATEILHDIEVTIAPNEMVGIVGESGAGKTTFFHLLTGLLEPTSGRIRFGDTDYDEIDKDELRALIGYVTQEPVIFDDTVANNISMWQCDGDDPSCFERIRTAAQEAKCEAFIAAMEDGFDTKLGDRGIRLSGGQRQRVAIARELFKNPRILIFDEAASALDAESEAFVQESIDRMRGERTVVIISHRLASVRNCDRIYVFSAGRVVEQGTFDELYCRETSQFRRMCDRQGVST